MRATQWCVMTMGLAAVLLRTANASAQTNIQQTTDSVTVGAALGGVVNFGGSGSGSWDVSVLVERFVVSTWHVRAEIARGTFVLDVPKGAPRQAVSLTRVECGAIDTTPAWMPGQVVGYVGGGMGGYRFGFNPAAGANSDFTRFGVYAVAGMMAPRDTPFSIAVQEKVHIVRGPGSEPGVFHIVASASIGARLRF